MSSSKAESIVTDDIVKRLSDPAYKEEFGAELAKTYVAIALALARHDAGLTQEALAQMIGSSQSYIAKLESGEANPTIGRVGRILAKMDRRLVVDTEPLIPGESSPSVTLTTLHPTSGVSGFLMTSLVNRTFQPNDPELRRSDMDTTRTVWFEIPQERAEMFDSSETISRPPRLFLEAV